MAEHHNVAIARNAYESFAKGDLDGALTDLAEDCVFHFGGDGPNSGDHKGREAIAAALIKNFELTAGKWALDIRGIYADDDHAAVVLHETASRTSAVTLQRTSVGATRTRSPSSRTGDIGQQTSRRPLENETRWGRPRVPCAGPGKRRRGWERLTRASHSD